MARVDLTKDELALICVSLEFYVELLAERENLEVTLALALAHAKLKRAYDNACEGEDLLRQALRNAEGARRSD